jgi:hypothetical protein
VGLEVKFYPTHTCLLWKNQKNRRPLKCFGHFSFGWFVEDKVLLPHTLPMQSICQAYSDESSDKVENSVQGKQVTEELNRIME